MKRPFFTVVPLFAAALLCGAFGFAAPVHAAVTCGTTTAQNGIKVTPSHGQAFYIDTGASPKLDAGYVGYQVYNGTGSTQNNLWVEVLNFSGGAVSLANPDDANMQLASTTNNATTTAYFLLKATGATSSAQAHTVRVYNGRPDVSGSSLLYECTYSFSTVKETIKAASNKVTDNTGDSVAITASTQSPELGQTFTITVEGQTGTIGNGSSPDNSIVWLTPAAVSSWPTRALRLVGVSVIFDTNANWNSTGDQVTYTNQLAITNAKTALTNSAEYRATYTFRVVGKPSSTVSVVPLADISSGTQIKHADTTATGATINLSFNSLAIDATLSKTVTATTSLTTITCTSTCTVPGGTNGMTYAAVPYRLQVTTATTTTATVDEMVDQPPTGVIFKSGSATITDIGRTSVALADPVYVASEASLSPRPYHFVGPFTFNSGTVATLNYTMYVPVGTFINTAYAVLGDTFIGANASAMSQVTVTSNGTASITAATSTQSFPVTAITEPATSITSTAATLNGVVDPNGTTPLTGTFEYGTSPTLTTYTSVTATTPSSGTLGGLTDPTLTAVGLTGLSVNTTYYFRAVAGTTKGDILSFTTDSVQATPTVTTQAASGISLTQATMNGTINPNLTAVNAIQFISGTNAALTSGVTTTTLDDGTGLALTAGGSSAQPFATTTGTLTGGSTYYYKIRACTAISGTYPSITCTSFVDGSVVNFTTYGVPTASTTAATSIGASVATLNGVIKANFATTTASFVYGTSSSLSANTITVSAGSVTGSASTTVSTSVSGLSSATTYYFRVVGDNTGGTTNGTILSFTTSAVNRTLSIDSGSYTSSYVYGATPPTITSTPSAGTGTKTYTSYTTSVCTINSSTGLVTFVTTGTCTIGASISANGGFTDASSPTISFSITPANRTLTIDSGSYTSSYAFDASVPTLTATPSAGTGTITYTSETGSVCSVDSTSGLVSFITTGTCTIHAAISAVDPYNAATSASISFSITNASRTLSIDSGSHASSYSLTATPPMLTATPSAGTGTITFTSLSTGICTVNTNSGLVAFVTAGTCSIEAAITAGGGYAAATSSDISITLILASRSLSIDGSSYTANYAYDAAPPTITSTPSAGSGTKSYTSLTSSVCSVNSSTGAVTFVGTGTCTLQASIGADATYASATSGSISFSITSLTRTLVIDTASYSSSYIITDDPPTITSTPSAGSGTKSYTSLTPSVCSVGAASGAIGFLTTGTCTVSASIAANGVYDSADSSSISFAINDVPPPPGLSARTLTIDASSYAANYVYNAPAPTLTATPSAGTGAITFTSLTGSVCAIDASSGAVTFVGVGTCRVRATIAEDATYASATSPTVSFDVLALSRTLTIDSASYAASYALSDHAPTITSTPSAGTGTKSYGSATPSTCSVDATSGVVTFLSTGTCMVNASISISGVYASADATAISFSIVADPLRSRTLTIDASSFSASYAFSDHTPTITSTPSAGTGTKSYASTDTSICIIDSGTGVVTFRSAGTCTLTASIDTDGVYDVASSPSISFTITVDPLRSRTLAIDGSSYAASYLTTDNGPTLTATPSAGTGAITFTSLTGSLCSVDASSGVVLLLGSGTCSINATIASDSTYAAATSPTISFTVTVPESTTSSRSSGRGNVPAVRGCMDKTALNYNSKARIDSGACVYKPTTNISAVPVTPAAARTNSGAGSSAHQNTPTITAPASQTPTCPYFTVYLKQGDSNPEVLKVKAFLNQVLGTHLDASSPVYDVALSDAVKRFQKERLGNVLAPWGLAAPTGRWYQSTRKAANDLMGCVAPVKLDNGRVIK